MTNIVEEEIDSVDLCKPMRPGHVFFPEERNITATIALCKNMKARISVIKNSADDDELTQKALNGPTNLSAWGMYQLFEKKFMS